MGLMLIVFGASTCPPRLQSLQEKEEDYFVFFFQETCPISTSKKKVGKIKNDLYNYSFLFSNRTVIFRYFDQ